MSAAKGSVGFPVILRKCAGWGIIIKPMSAMNTGTSYSPKPHWNVAACFMWIESSASADANGVYSFTGIERASTALSAPWHAIYEVKQNCLVSQWENFSAVAIWKHVLYWALRGPPAIHQRHRLHKGKRKHSNALYFLHETTEKTQQSLVRDTDGCILL